MLWFSSWIVLVSFWFYALRLARRDSIYLSLVFIFLWGAARFGFAQLGTEGPIVFISFSALLTAVMVFIDLYRHNMGLRKPQRSPIDQSNQHD